MTREKIAHSGILQRDGVYAKVLLYIMSDNVNIAVTIGDLIKAIGDDRQSIQRALIYLEKEEYIRVSKGITSKSPNIICLNQDYQRTLKEVISQVPQSRDNTMSYDMVIDIDEGKTIRPDTKIASVSPSVLEPVSQSVSSSVLESVSHDATAKDISINDNNEIDGDLSVSSSVLESVSQSVLGSVSPSVSNTVNLSGHIDDSYMMSNIFIYVLSFLSILEKEEISNYIKAGKIYDFYKEHLRGSTIRKDAVKKIEDLLSGTHYYDKKKVYTAEEIVNAIGRYQCQYSGKGQGILYDANAFFGKDLIFHLYLPGTELVENVSEMREIIEERRTNADELLVIYEKHIKPSKRRMDARNSIENLLAGRYAERPYTKEELRSAVLAYGKTRVGKDMKYHYDAANFFGEKAYFYNYLPENQVEPQKAETKKDDGVFHMEI